MNGSFVVSGAISEIDFRNCIAWLWCDYCELFKLQHNISKDLKRFNYELLDIWCGWAVFVAGSATRTRVCIMPCSWRQCSTSTPSSTELWWVSLPVWDLIIITMLLIGASVEWDEFFLCVFVTTVQQGPGQGVWRHSGGPTGHHPAGSSRPRQPHQLCQLWSRTDWLWSLPVWGNLEKVKIYHNQAPSTLQSVSDSFNQ